MVVPEGYTQEQVLKIINDILNIIAHRYTFSVFDVDDIKQEGFLLALEGLIKYNGSFPLENFLRVHLNNRLKDFKRNNSFKINTHCVSCKSFTSSCEACAKRQQTQDTKRNLLNPIDIDIINDDAKSTSYNVSLIDTLEMLETVEKINVRLPVSYRKDYLKIKDGLYVSKARREEIEKIITEIIQEDD